MNGTKKTRLLTDRPTTCYRSRTFAKRSGYKIPTSVQNGTPERPVLEPSQRTINSVDYYHCVYELLYRLIESSIALVPTLSPSQGATIMKRQILMSLSLSLLASTAFALPASEQATPQVKDSRSVYSQTVAEDGFKRTPLGQTVAEGGYERTPQGQTVAEGGYERTPQGQTVAEGGYERTPQGQTVAEGGRDRLEEKGLVEGGYERTPQGQTVAEGGGDRVIERNSAVS
jgi:hypothetical protein